MEKKHATLIVNLGTPKEPTPREVRKYLKLFLSDQRVIRTSSWLWQPLLRFIILPIRAPKSAKLYQNIWSDSKGSPLEYYTNRQASLLQKELPTSIVKYAMSYSNPSIEETLSELDSKGVTDLTVIPLYPQYSTTTVSSVHDSIHKYYLKRQSSPNLHIVSDFSDYAPYIDALSAKINEDINKYQPDGILFSYHGIPKSYQDSGYPYAQRCNQTTKAVIDKLDLQIPYFQSYQSKFGPAEWLKPATSDLLSTLSKQGIKKILVVAPSFISDCLETIDELGRENREVFMNAGGTDYHVVDCLNDDPNWISALATLAKAQ